MYNHFLRLLESVVTFQIKFESSSLTDSKDNKEEKLSYNLIIFKNSFIR